MEPDELGQILKKTNKISIAIDHLNIGKNDQIFMMVFIFINIIILFVGYGLGDYDDVIDISTLEKFTVLKDDLMYDWCVFSVSKHSVILPVLDNFIMQLRESGLDYYYLAEVRVVCVSSLFQE